MRIIPNLGKHLAGCLLAVAAFGGLATAATCDNAAEQVQGAYLAYYGRSADPAGLDYWTGRLTATGCDLREIIGAFSGAPEFTTLYSGKSNADIIDAVYQQLFDRAPDEAGKAFYLGLLESGARSLSTIMADIYYGATGTDLEVLANKRTVSDYFTSEVDLTDTSYTDANKAENIALMAEVGLDAASVTSGVGAVDAFVETYVVPLVIAHINDHHSHLEPNTSAKLKFGGIDTTVVTGGFPRVVTKMLDLAAQHEKILLLHAGDATTGTIYFTSFKGEADAALMNEICFDAMEVGNHEFDDGDVGLAKFIGFLHGDSAVCETPVLGANVIPAVGTPLRPDELTSLLQPYVILERAGQQFGVIGIEVAAKTQASSSPLDSTQFLDEIATAQQYIDELTAMGVDKIVVLSHFGYDNELNMAESLRGVDVVIGGDSHTLLGDGFAAFGLSPLGPYPTEVMDLDGNPVCVAQAWQYADVVGELKVKFNGNGVVTNCSGTPTLLLGDSFKQGGTELDGDARQAVLDAIAAAPELEIVTPDAQAAAVLAPFTDEIAVLKTQVAGIMAENLCISRLPGDGRSGICPKDATLVYGGDVQQLVTYAYLQRGFEADVAVQNAGGVRVDLPTGDTTIAKVFELLPFSNTLVYLDVTGAQLRQVLEEALENVVANNSTGAYPYAAGLRWDADLSKPFGSRLSNIEIRRKGTTEWVPLNDADAIKVVTNSFVAAGGDNYTTFKSVPAVNTYIDYAQGFIDYMQQDVGGAKPGDPILEVPPLVGPVSCAEYSTQSYIGKDGVKQVENPLVPSACH